MATLILNPHHAIEIFLTLTFSVGDKSSYACGKYKYERIRFLATVREGNKLLKNYQQKTGDGKKHTVACLKYKLSVRRRFKGYCMFFQQEKRILT